MYFFISTLNVYSSKGFEILIKISKIKIQNNEGQNNFLSSITHAEITGECIAKANGFQEESIENII
jgi:hypothetical protein